MDFGLVWSRTCRVDMVVKGEIMPNVFIPPDWKNEEKERSEIQGGRRKEEDEGRGGGGDHLPP
ncbi:unnamed protein product [Prunus armeniaca]|uniref:Uncharacterized protein n=1 Tax=Prunus armeniaca TaxID=36596 RepID=A0A6J5U5T1_PRUAR|nr:unnamed protein product [Prunus armeniaca]CAB4301357.1 unnamed protein product [Prunus armeniaca]